MAQDKIDVQAQLLKSLLKKVSSDPFPSASMMDTVEELLTPDTVSAYAQVLLAHIDKDNFPSVSMIDRLKRLSVG
jgi:hypothetical protein